MSTSQTLSNIATGLRAVDCELAAMRSLNGTLVSALTTKKVITNAALAAVASIYDL